MNLHLIHFLRGQACLAALCCALLSGCGRPPSADVDRFPRATIPAPRYAAKFYISNAERTGTLQIDPAGWDGKTAPWNAMALGIGGNYYAMRIQYVGHGKTGDLYSYVIYKPYPEKETPRPQPVVESEGMVEFSGTEQNIHKQDDVEYLMKE